MDKLNTEWSYEEIALSVRCYKGIIESDGSVPKKRFYEELSKRIGRTIKSVEYRMQNISYIYHLMGRNWIKGLPPAKNVGFSVSKMIERAIGEVETINVTDNASYLVAVKDELKSKAIIQRPMGIDSPRAKSASVTVYERSPKVAAWVLRACGGKCEYCDQEAPFKDIAGDPFLEVHHVKRLADGGPDAVENCVALCPNCHRNFHYGIDRLRLVDKLYVKIGRLKLC